jgi:hypothetical protein
LGDGTAGTSDLPTFPIIEIALLVPSSLPGLGAPGDLEAPDVFMLRLKAGSGVDVSGISSDELFLFRGNGNLLSSVEYRE